MLCGKKGKLLEGVQFVAVEGRGVGKSGGKFVFPFLGVPKLARRLHKLLEFGRNGPHVGRATKNQGVGLMEELKLRRCFFDRQQSDIGRDLEGSFLNMFGYDFRMPYPL